MKYKCETCGATKESKNEAPMCCDKSMVEVKEEKSDYGCCCCG